MVLGRSACGHPTLHLYESTPPVVGANLWGLRMVHGWEGCRRPQQGYKVPTMTTWTRLALARYCWWCAKTREWGGRKGEKGTKLQALQDFVPLKKEGAMIQDLLRPMASLCAFEGRGEYRGPRPQPRAVSLRQSLALHHLPAASLAPVPPIASTPPR